ncbi:MAG: hypothetical protein RLY58_766 [Pseudomonadota bacterium]|jgi:pteridine reductase
MTERVVCITGSGVRIGAHLADVLHAQGWRVVLHGRHNLHEAQAHADRLNAQRPHSACAVQGDLLDMQHLPTLAHTIGNAFGRLDALVHNASSFFSTPMGQATQQDWDDLMGSNARAPFFLTQALLPHLQATQGVVLSILDIHANGQPFAGYPIYNMAKAAHRMMVQALAKDLAPDVRVNGVAPGANLWPDAHSPSALDDDLQQRVSASIPLQRIGTPDDLAHAIVYLLDARYVTGQILAVDGGRSLTLAGE